MVAVMKKWTFILVMVVLTGIMAGCGQGSEYEGKWVAAVKSDWDGSKIVVKLDIKKNGENYIINSAAEQYRDTAKIVGEAGKKAAWSVSEGKPVSATLKDGKLAIDPFRAFTFIKADGTILGPNGEVYKKETVEEVKKLKQEATATFKEKNPKMIIEE